ncbi:MAG: peptide-N-glycosidase F-related protein [Deltaproteobacteria bacterium]|nr:peptide-N-glycosidase F-related protein [Deltaproteobacteria bacterium]
MVKRMQRTMVLAAIAALSAGCPSPSVPSDASVTDGSVDVVDDMCGERCATPSRLAPGPYGTRPHDLAGDFTVETTEGPWRLSDHFDGTDHYVFLVYTPGTIRFGDGTDYSQGLFDGPLDELLRRSPRNVHYFFLWNRNEQGFQDFAATLPGQLALLSAEDQAHWRTRLHAVTRQASMIQGWVGDVVRARLASRDMVRRYEAYQWAVDRTQHVREVGQLGTLTRSGLAPDLTFLANEPRYYEFEFAREQRLSTQNATVLPVFTNQRVDDWEGPRNWRDAVAYGTVDVPDVSRFDTLEVDLSMQCINGRDGDCGAWDYISDLRLCEEPTSAPDAGADANTGTDGSSDALEVTDASDASDVATDAPETFRPRRAGCDREIARWITTYWREGRWVTDISQLLPLFATPGRRTLRWYSKHQFDPREVPYIVSLSLRLSNRNRGMRPVAVQNLWSGESDRFDSAYDSRHPARQFTVPAGTRRVEVYSLITGHGADTSQCAEFCNHTHHFALNGGPAQSVAFPEAQSPMGCADRVGEGVVPNQHGTWYFGRGGWCPGEDVRPHVLDLTPGLRPGSNELTYRALVGTQAMVAGRNYGNIDHATYLIYWR